MPSQLVAYSGFSPTNYIQEPYSADLDYGTGEWSVSAWVSAPVVLPVNSFPIVGSDLAVGNDFAAWSVVGGVSSVGAVSVTTTSTGGVFKTNLIGANKAYRLVATGTTANGFNIRTTGSTIGQVAVPSGAFNISVLVSVVTADLYLQFIGAGTTTFDTFSISEVGNSVFLDRSAATGPSVKAGMNGYGKLVATVYDGTTTRTVTTDAAYNNGVFAKVRATYIAGKLGITVNGVEVASTTGAPLLTLNNASAVLTIGNSRALDAPFPGSIALLKLGATVPTPEQAVWMYEQEKQMFRADAQVCLPAATAVLDLAYDESQDKWVSVQATYKSNFVGLVRTAATTPSAGSFSKVSAVSGAELLARTTTSPGVDVTIPAYGLREELVRRSEAAAKSTRPMLVTNFDTVGFTGTTVSSSNQITAVVAVSGVAYVGMGITGSGIPAGTTITGINGNVYALSANATASATAVSFGQSDFTLSSGMTAIEVMSAGASRREGATKDFTRLFDGFRETIRFGVSPGSATWVQILQRKE